VPLRAYEPLQTPCRLCGTGFDVMQSATEPVLQECPRCGQPVRPRTVAAVSTPKVAKPTSASEAKSAGFTVLKRVGRGEYEKQ
jgi:hypothetical protein